MEELKLILETVASLGGSAKWLFVLYLAKGLLTNLAGFGCLAFFLLILKGVFQKLIESLSLIDQIKAKMEFSGCLTPGEKRRILSTIDRGLAR